MPDVYCGVIFQRCKCRSLDEEADMSTTKRVSGAMVAAVAFALGAVACSDGADGSGGPLTLTMWHGLTGPDGPAFQLVVDEFNESQDEITLAAEALPWEERKSA